MDPSSPLYLEVGLDCYPWIRHPSHAIIEGHHVYTINDFNHATGIYLASPCQTSCTARGIRTYYPWRFHIQGQIAHQKFAYNIPITSKHGINLQGFKAPKTKRQFFDQLQLYLEHHRTITIPKLNLTAFQPPRTLRGIAERPEAPDQRPPQKRPRLE